MSGRGDHLVALDWSKVDGLAFLALVVAVLTFLSGALGVYLVNRRARASQATADEGKRIAEESVWVAREALEETRQARSDALWSAAVEQAHGMIGFDPLTEEARPRFLALRVATGNLVDGLPEWEGLREWVRLQNLRGPKLAEVAMMKASPTDSPDERLEVLKPLLDWAIEYVETLRALRLQEYDPATMERLRVASDAALQAILDPTS